MDGIRRHRTARPRRWPAGVMLALAPAALSTSFYLPDVMAPEFGYVGCFAQGGGLEDLAKPPQQPDSHLTRA